MNDFWRLGVGVVLLGLAIFLSYNLDSSSNPDGHQNATVADPEKDGSIEATTNPQWQAPTPDNLTAPPAGLLSDGIARPVFQPPASAAGSPPALSASASSSPGVPLDLDQVPRMDDRYQALTRFHVAGSIRKDNGLVPVQPKPSFSGVLPQVNVVHRVRPGDTLQSIAVEYYGDARRYLDIYLANKHLLSNPARLPENIELRIPE